ncbi:MAG: BatD family protein [Kofleriaceae bacterium]
MAPRVGIALTLALMIAVVGAAVAPAPAQAQGAPAARYQLGGKAIAGSPFVLAIVAEGLDEDPAPALPTLAVPGLTITPGTAELRGSFQVTINGRRVQQGGGTWVLSYRVVAAKAGRFELPTATVTQGGKSVPVRGGTLEVTELPTTADMQFGVTLPDRPVYIGESFPAEIEWLLRKDPNGQELSVPLLTMDASLAVQVPDPTNPRQVLEFDTDRGKQQLGYIQDKVTRGGITYDRFRFPLVVTPKVAGSIVIPPASVVAELTVGQGRDAFGFPVARTDTFRATDQERTLVVRPVPETDKPPSFAGAVGTSFALTARASRSVVQLGEPLELELTVRSDQRLDTVQLAPLDGPGALPKARFAVPADRPIGELAADGLTKTFKVSVQVIAADTTEIPALPFSYFDASKGTYQTIHSEPIALSVKGGAVVGAAQVVGTPAGGPTAPTAAGPEASPTVSLAGVDLALSPPGADAGGLGRGLVWPLVGLLYLLPLGVFGVQLARRRGAARREVVGEVKTALRQLATELDGARTAPAKAAAVALSRALTTAARALGRTVDDGLIARIENAGFAPDAAGQPLSSELRAELHELHAAWTRDARRGAGAATTTTTAALVVLTLAWPGAAQADPATAQARGAYQDAMSATDPAVRQRGFAAAATGFAQAVAAHPSAALYADLGNAALGGGDVGTAVLAYRRALALDGAHARARRNLAWIRGRLPPELRPPSAASATDTLFFFHATWSRDRRLVVGALAFAVLVLVLVPWGQRRRRSLTPVAAVAGLVWLAMTVSLVIEDRRTDEAVVMQASVLRTADAAGAPAARVTPVPAGAEVTIGERRGDWVRVRLGSATGGWLPAGAVERVTR